MEKKLPARPNLEHLRGQAKALLAAAKAGDPQALSTLAEFNPAAPPAGPTLSDAQFAIARKHDFASWPKLVHYVEELTALEGTWAFTSLEVDGSVMPEFAFGRSRLVIDGDRFRMVSPEGTYEGIFDIGIEVKPHAIDIDFVEGPEAGNSSYGIYKLTGDELRICLGFTGVTRPTQFVTSAGGGHALETLRRTADRPSEPAPETKPSRVAAPTVDRAEFSKLTPEHERMQGEWIAVAITNSGMQLPSHFAQQGRRVTDGTRTSVKFGPQSFMEVLTRIDDSRYPIEIDYLNVSGAMEGQVQLGIMRWRDGLLEVCFGGVGLPRPDEFASPPNSGITLSSWRRRG